LFLCLNLSSAWAQKSAHPTGLTSAVSTTVIPTAHYFFGLMNNAIERTKAMTPITIATKAVKKITRPIYGNKSIPKNSRKASNNNNNVAIVNQQNINNFTESDFFISICGSQINVVLFILIIATKTSRNNMSCNVVQHASPHIQSEASLKFPQKCRRCFSHLKHPIPWF
jgi:hypothetical protein